MSPEHNQDYFSDGLSEELLNQLAQIKELRVAGRTSSFSFKGKNEDLRVIGEKLGVNHLLEGSVRKDGKQLRITAQLINAIDCTHMWSQTYDRELTGVFAIQEEIAMAVSGALSITLDVGAMSREKGGTTNVEAYDKYLRARKLFLQGGPKETVQAAQSFREALALDPNFGLAWLGLYDALRYTLIIVPETQAAARKEMEEVSAHIIKIEPNAWWAQATRAYQFADQHKWSEAEAALNAAMASAPASANLCGDFFGAFGRAKEAVVCAERQREADRLSLAAVRRSFVELHFTNFGWLWSYYETNLRSDPRFKDLLRDLGLVDYFRASGNWGDFCKPVGKDDFECH